MPCVTDRRASPYLPVLEDESSKGQSGKIILIAGYGSPLGCVARAFGWSCRRAWYFLLQSMTSSRTVWIPKSLWRTRLGTYHGASTRARSTIFWKRWSISILELLAAPHKGMPYVHIGLIIVLYNKILFSAENYFVLGIKITLSVVVKALRYRPEGSGFETLWGEWISSFI
jgi:hypothetical protein